MKRIYLDIGNSRIKMASRKNKREWSVTTLAVKKGALNLPSKRTKVSGDIHFIISSVRNDWLKLVKSEISGHRTTVLDKKWIPAHHLDYDTTATLGIDRYLSCLGAVEKANKDVIAIDAGSAITVDYMTSDKIFKGGVIIPGKRVILEAMKKELPELPLPDHIIPDAYPGKSTMDCIRWGVNGSFQAILKQFIIRYQEMAEQPVDIFITGGDMNYIKSLMPDDWPVQCNDFTIFEGMESFMNLFVPDK